MAKYLVSCACGRQLPVEPGQAGEALVCDCGATVAVPTLRQMRQLPEARDYSAAAGGSVWGLRHSAITVSLLLAAVCLILTAASRMSERPVPVVDPMARTQNVDREVSNLSPLGAWQLWISSYESLSTKGFEEIKHPAADAMQRDLDWHRAIQKTLLIVAAGCVVAAAVMGITKTRRQGDKETWRT